MSTFEEEKGLRRNADDNRLNRIENKIDRLSEAMISLARAEERIMQMEIDRKLYWEKMNSMSDRVDEIAKQSNNSSRMLGFAGKAFWVGIAAAATILISRFM